MDSQCAAITIKKTQCTRNAVNGKYCNIHNKKKKDVNIEKCSEINKNGNKCNNKVKYEGLCKKHVNIKYEGNIEQTITITFAEKGENHVGCQQIGIDIEEGFNIKELKKIKSKFENMGYECELINIKNNLTDTGNDCDEEARILIIRSLDFGEELIDEMNSLKWDRKCKMYGRVVEKKVRHNLCFAEENQEPDYENGKGTIVSFDDLPELSKVKKLIQDNMGDKVSYLVAEGNNYYDLNQCLINFHNDMERKMVIGLRLGATMPLYFQWFYKGERIGERVKLILNNKDMYVMSSKCVGFDGKKRNIYTLRHAAGREHLLK